MTRKSEVTKGVDVVFSLFNSSLALTNLINLSHPHHIRAKAGVRPRLKPHTVSPRLPVPTHIPLPPYVDTGTNPYDEGIQTHDAAGVAKMRAAGALAADVLAFAGTLVAPGVTTDAIDKAVHARILEAGAYPSPLTYGNFPKSVCTSVNECICHGERGTNEVVKGGWKKRERENTRTRTHPRSPSPHSLLFLAGIPDARPLVSGDILNIDVTVYLDGHHGDTSRMFFVGGAGAASPDAGRLCAATKEALDAAIALVRPGLPVSAIGDAIQGVADREKLGIVREFVGHGVGRVFHSNPAIVHCRNREPGVLVAGQTFTIEPMLTLGSPRSKMWKDGWTVVTADASLTAQFEHTLLVTEGGVEVLTAWPDKQAAAVMVKEGAEGGEIKAT